MKRALLASLFVAGALFAILRCAPPPETVVTAPKGNEVATAPDPKNVVIPHPLLDPKSKTPPPVEIPAKPVEPVKEAVPSKIDPAVLGSYKLKLSNEQRSQIMSSIEKMRLDAEKGVQGAESGLAMATAALELVDKLEVKLLAGGKFSADFGDGAKDGTFTMRGDKLILRPKDQPTDKTVPPDMELTFDKSKKTLTADFQGQEMVFERKG